VECNDQASDLVINANMELAMAAAAAQMQGMAMAGMAPMMPMMPMMPMGGWPMGMPMGMPGMMGNGMGPSDRGGGERRNSDRRDSRDGGKPRDGARGSIHSRVGPPAGGFRDPRSIRTYTDLDTAPEGEVEISYD